MFYVKSFIKIDESSTCDLSSIISDDRVGDSILAYDVFPYEILDIFSRHSS